MDNIEKIREKVKKIKNSVKFTMMPRGSMWDKSLTDRDRELLAYLSVMCGNKIICWPSIKFLCYMCNLDPETSRRNVEKRLVSLERLGYIRRHKRTNTDGKKITNGYQIILDVIDEQIEFNEEDMFNCSTPDIDDIDDFDENTILSEGTRLKSTGYPPTRLESTGYLPGQDQPGTYRYINKEKEKEKEIGLSTELSPLSVDKESIPSSRSLSAGLPLDSGIDSLKDENLPPEEGGEERIVQTPTEQLSLLPEAKKTPSGPIAPVDDIWEIICKNMRARNPRFEYWMVGLKYKGILGQKLHLEGESTFWAQYCSTNFAHEILNVCKKLQMNVSFVEIKER